MLVAARSNGKISKKETDPHSGGGCHTTERRGEERKEERVPSRHGTETGDSRGTTWGKRQGQPETKGAALEKTSKWLSRD